jgi:hypothetical protein
MPSNRTIPINIQIFIVLHSRGPKQLPLIRYSSADSPKLRWELLGCNRLSSFF